MSDHQANATNYQEKLNAQFGRSKSAEEEKELLREQIVDLRKVIYNLTFNNLRKLICTEFQPIFRTNMSITFMYLLALCVLMTH